MFYAVRDHPHTPAKSFCQVLPEQDHRVIRYGGGGSLTTIFTGFLSFDLHRRPARAGPVSAKTILSPRAMEPFMEFLTEMDDAAPSPVNAAIREQYQKDLRVHFWKSIISMAIRGDPSQ